MYNNKIKHSIFSIEFRDVIVQLKFSLNSICETKLTIITRNEVSPTEQAKGDSGKKPELPLWQNEGKTLGETSYLLGEHFFTMYITWACIAYMLWV